MITFKQFISEESKFSPIVLQTTDEFIDWCEKNSSSYLKNAAKYPIYRGMNNLKLLSLTNSNDFDRRSANTSNYYSWWIDNNPTWKDYPKRSKSLICSTSVHQADRFGDVSLVIPSDSNKIGICSAEDLWYSFTFIEKLFNDSSIGMEAINVWLHQTFEALELAVGFNFKDPKTYEEYIELLKLCSIENLEIIMENEHSKMFTNFLTKMINKCKHEGINNFFELFNVILTPTENKFKLTTGSKFKCNGDHEIWVQGESALISLNKDKILRDQKLVEFLETYNLLKLFGIKR